MRISSSRFLKLNTNWKCIFIDHFNTFPPTQVVRPTIRSQFACTYKDDELPLNRVLEFPSASQLPTCAHPAPKRTISSHASVEEKCDSPGMDNRLKGSVSAKLKMPLCQKVVLSLLVVVY